MDKVMDEPRLQFAQSSKFSETQELYPTGEILRRKPYREPRIRFNEPSKYTAGAIRKVDLELEDARRKIEELEKQVAEKNAEIEKLTAKTEGGAVETDTIKTDEDEGGVFEEVIGSPSTTTSMMAPAAEEATPKVPEAGTDILLEPEPGPAAAPDAAPEPGAPAGIDSEAAPDAALEPGAPAGIDPEAPMEAAAPGVMQKAEESLPADDDQSVTSETNDDLVLTSLQPPLPQIEATDK